MQKLKEVMFVVTKQCVTLCTLGAPSAQRTGAWNAAALQLRFSLMAVVNVSVITLFKMQFTANRFTSNIICHFGINLFQPVQPTVKNVVIQRVVSLVMSVIHTLLWMLINSVLVSMLINIFHKVQCSI